jgi:hypothetical protein
MRAAATLVGTTASAAIFSPSLTEIVRYSQQAQARFDIGYAVLRGNDLLIQGSIAGGALLTPLTGGASLALAAVGAGVSLGLQEVESKYQEAAETEIRRSLKTELDTYEKQYGEDAYRQLTSSTDPAEVRNTLDAKLGDIFGTELNDLPKDTLLGLWRELHPDAPLQLQLPFAVTSRDR